MSLFWSNYGLTSLISIKFKQTLYFSQLLTPNKAICFFLFATLHLTVTYFLLVQSLVRRRKESLGRADNAEKPLRKQTSQDQPLKKQVSLDPADVRLEERPFPDVKVWTGVYIVLSEQSPRLHNNQFSFNKRVFVQFPFPFFLIFLLFPFNFFPTQGTIIFCNIYIPKY